MMVDFLVVGAQKSGTTALDKYLRLHPQIEMARQKEVHFFDNENNFAGVVDYTSYHQSFANNSGDTLKGEVTPIYMYWDSAPRRIWEYNPAMKLIAVLRSPIERAFSHWNMERDRNTDTSSFSEAIRLERVRCRSALPLQHRVFSYVDRGFYSEQLRRLWRYFPEGQTLIIKHEELKLDLSNTLTKIANFLGVKDFDHSEYLDIHSRAYLNQMSSEDFYYLRDVFYSEVKMLEAMLGWSCDSWLDPPEMR